MAEKSIDIVAEKIERLDVRRNTSNQIISYTLPEGSDKLYGMYRISGQKTSFPINDFNRVIFAAPSELINPIPEFEINIVSKATLNKTSFRKPIAPRPSVSIPNRSSGFTEAPITAPVSLNSSAPVSFGSTSTLAVEGGNTTSPPSVASVIGPFNPNITIGKLPNYLSGGLTTPSQSTIINNLKLKFPNLYNKFRNRTR